MLLRITQTPEGRTTVLTIAGQLVGDGVAELARVAQAAKAPLALDLTHLQQADADGIALLQALADAGAPLHGVSPYIALLLARP
jgi:ABC-type transporter Mla MlaB component